MQMWSVVRTQYGKQRLFGLVTRRILHEEKLNYVFQSNFYWRNENNTNEFIAGCLFLNPLSVLWIELKRLQIYFCNFFFVFLFFSDSAANECCLRAQSILIRCSLSRMPNFNDGCLIFLSEYLESFNLFIIYYYYYFATNVIINEKRKEIEEEEKMVFCSFGECFWCCFLDMNATDPVIIHTQAQRTYGNV